MIIVLCNKHKKSERHLTMNIKHLLLITITLLCSTNAYSMDPTSLYELRRTGQQNITHTNNQNTFITIPEDVWLYIIAHYHIKDDIRKTCKYFHKLASSTNTALLTHPSLVLSEKALEQFLLYHAAMGDTAIVRNLLAIGADPNACDDKQMTAMHYAAQYGHVEIVDMLLQHPALITTGIDTDRDSPFKLAIQRDHNMVVKTIFLACNLNGTNTLHYAIRQGALNSVRTLLACNIDPNALTSNDCHPLIEATCGGNTHIIKLLIDKGAKVNYRSKDKDNINTTPLHFAARNGHTNATQLLINYGANVNLKGTDTNITPLHVASTYGHVPIIKILLNNNADINTTDNNNETPLYYAINSEHTDATQLLIDYGANINIKGTQNNITDVTPLHLASHHGYIDIVKILLQNGAYINEKDSNNLTPLDYTQDDEIRELLIARGGKTSAQLQQRELEKKCAPKQSNPEKENCVVQ